MIQKYSIRVSEKDKPFHGWLRSCCIQAVTPEGNISINHSTVVERSKALIFTDYQQTIALFNFLKTSLPALTFYLDIFI